VTVPVGVNLTLTNSANQSTGGADNLTGTAGNDTFLAVADGALDNGDVVNGAGGTDTLIARYSLTANKIVNTSVSNVETVLVDIDDGNAAAHTLTLNVDSFAGLKTIGVKDNNSTNAAEDTVAFTNIATGVGLAVVNGDAFSKVDFGFKTTTSLTDVAALSMEAGVADTITIAGIETINIDAVSGKSSVDTLTTTATTTLTVSGAGQLTLKNIDDVTKTIDASKMTGKLSVDGVGTVDLTFTGGSGDDTVAMGTTLTTADVLAGGNGTDTLIVGASLTSAMSKVTSFEAVTIKAAIADAATVTLSGAAITGATKFIVESNAAANNADATVALTNIENGDVISVVSAGGDSTSLADGVALTVTQVTDTISDAYTLSLEGIGAVTADATANTGIAAVTIDSVETLTIASNANSTNTVTVNNAEQLQVQAATGLVITGSADLDLDSIVNTTKLVSIDASQATGKLNIDGIDASALVFKAAAKDTVISLAGLNNADQLIGGAGTKDSVVATTITGLTATTGKLNIQNFETVELQATGANTIDASLMTGVKTLAISGATPGNQTVTNVAATGLSVSAGSATAVFDAAATLEIKLADETGASDQLALIVDNTASDQTDVALKTTAIETINISVAATSGNDAAVSMTNSTAANITVTGGGAGAVLALGTLNAAVRSVNVSAYAGEVSFSGANASAGMTVTASSWTTGDSYTTSAFADTITIAETGLGTVLVDGGALTDTLNLALKAGFVDTSGITNVENINLSVRAGDSITIGAGANQSNGIDAAKALTLTGGNELSVFKIAGDNLAGTTLLSVDASAFAGKLDLKYAADALLSTMVIKAGALTTDTVNALYDTAAGSFTLQTNGVEAVRLGLNSGNTAADEAYSFDISKMTGLTTLSASTQVNNNATMNVTAYTSATTIQLGDNTNDDTARDAGEEFGNSSTLAVTLASASGTADTLNISLQDTDNATGTIAVTAAGVEVLNIKTLNSGEGHKLNLAGVTPTTDSKLTINVTGTATDTVTITNVSANANVINASGLAGALTISDRGSSAMTITGGTGADSLRMENAADVMTGGSGTDTLVIAQNAVLGGFQIDLSASGDQVTTYNGSANSAVQSGFENVDMSGVTGTFGADITARSAGSTITGTSNSDQITLNSAAAADNVKMSLGGNSDTIIGFAAGAGADTLTITAGLLNGTKVTDLVELANVAAFTGGGGILTANTVFVEITASQTLGGVDTVAEVAALIGGGTAITDIAAADSIIIALDDGQDMYLWNWVDTGTNTGIVNAAELTLVAKLVGVTDIATLDLLF
jgi:hypothetical protein